MGQSGKVEAAAPPIFILSCGRSGSTLLRYVMDTHPDVCSPGELGLGTLCDKLYHAVYYTLGQTAARSPADREEFTLAEVRRVVSELMQTYARAKGKRIWCEKTPGNVLHLDLLARVFPDAQYLCLHRNCMDVVHSCVELYRLGYDAWAAPYVQRHPKNFVAAMVESWNDNTARLIDFERRHPAQCVSIKYEDIVLQPNETMSVVFAVLGLAPAVDLRRSVFSVPHEDGSGDPKSAFMKKFDRGSIGKGSRLPSERIPAPLWARMNELLAELDYPTVGPDWNDTPSPYLPAEDDPDDHLINSPAEAFDRQFPALLSRYPKWPESLKARCKFNLTGDGGGVWIVDLTKTENHISAGDAPSDCTIKMEAADFIDMANGQLIPGTAIGMDKVHLEGNRELAVRIGRVLFGS